MERRTPRRLGLLLATAFLLPSPRALAYTPSRIPGGPAFHWSRACVALRVYVDGLPSIAPDQIMKAARGAAAAWSAAANPCASIDIVVERADGPGPKRAFDGNNTIVFRGSDWCAPNDILGECSYDPSEQGMSTLLVRSSGEIVEADLEINARYFQLADVDVEPAAGKVDLQNVLTHELGHLLGFGHTCWEGSPSMAPLDDADNAVPACSNASQAVRDTTMFVLGPLREVSKRTLAPDDQRAVCETYPRATPDPADGGTAPPTFAACAAPDVPSPDGGDASTDANDASADGDDASTDANDANTGPNDATPGSVPDARSAGDRATDGGPAPLGSGGCGCAIGGTSGDPAALLLALAFCRWRRRRASLQN